MADTAHPAAGPARQAGSGAVSGMPAQRADRDALACGAPVDLLVEQVDAGYLEPSDAHQSGCQHCQAALLQAATAGQALALLRASRGPVPADLVGKVMRAVRRTRQPGALIELAPPGVGRDHGTDVQVAGSATGSGTVSGVVGVVRVHRQVLADLARVAADGLRGVRVARASASGQPGRPGAVAVSLGLLVDGRTPLPELAPTVRRAVRAALRASTGSSEVQVELAALDLIERREELEPVDRLAPDRPSGS